MKTILLYAVLLVVSLGYSQSGQITIIGNMPQEHGGDYVSFSKPIGKYTTDPFYINSRDTAAIKNNRFIKNLAISGPGLIFIFEKPFNGRCSARFFAEPGDTIVLERQNKEIIFKGKNAVVNKMYTDVKIAPVAFNDEVYDIFKDNNSSGKIIAKINDKEKEYLKIYNEFFQKKQISKSCLEYTKVAMEQSIESMAMNIAKADDYRKTEKMSITKEDANKIIAYINLKYIPFKEENLKSLFTIGLIKDNAFYIEEQYLRENKKITRFWNQFDTIFKSKRENFGAIDYIEHDDYKETYIGRFFFDLIKSYDNEKTVKYKDLVTVYKAFAEKFPNSPYLIILSESIMNVASDNLNTNVTKVEPKTTLGNLTVYDTILKTDSTEPFAKPNQSLIDALAEKFPNQDLFVDLWATWCGPCIKQFTYNKDLHSFLDSKNIKTLYVSDDKEEDIIKWEKYIGDYDLTGYHFLPNKAYQEKFIAILGKYIPMYLVYNSKTKKLTKLEGYPSEKEKFYTQIDKVLLTK